VINDGGTAIVAGGLMAGDVSSNVVFRVDTQGRIVTRLASLPAPLHDAAGMLVAGRPVLIGGGGFAELSAAVGYGTDRRWRVVGHLPGPRSDLSVVPGTHGLLVVGGYDGVGSPRVVLQSQDGRRFRAFARLRTAVRYTAAVTVGGSVWIFGGENRQREVRTVQQIDLESRTVRTAGLLPHPLAHASVLAIDSRILLIGGRTKHGRVTDKMWWFSPTTHHFTSAGRLPYPVGDAGLWTAGRTAYLLGGETPAFTKRVTHLRLVN
jgi:N-acetylneuraminic acid mutarotase